MAPTPLTLLQLQKAQAEAEGFQNGPEPALNNANLYIAAIAGNPQPTPPVPTPTPYYPSSETPNLQLSTRDVPAEMANNLVILDSLFPTGSGIGVPIIQAELTAVNTTVPHTITETASTTTLYAISLFIQSLGTGGAGDTITVTINYVSPASATPLTITILMHLDSANVVMETYPLLVSAGTTISMSSAYGGAYADPYTISCKLVEMP
jgi:hypothetical protein